MKLGGGGVINKINSLSFGGGKKKFSNCPLEGGGNMTHLFLQCTSFILKHLSHWSHCHFGVPYGTRLKEFPSAVHEKSSHSNKFK